MLTFGSNLSGCLAIIARAEAGVDDCDAAATADPRVLSYISWTNVALRLPGRTAKDCRKRLVYSLDVSLRKGPWTEEEDQLLLEAMAAYASSSHRHTPKVRWSVIARAIGSRSGDQASKRWREVLKPALERAALFSSFKTSSPLDSEHPRQQRRRSVESDEASSTSYSNGRIGALEECKSASVPASISSLGPVRQRLYRRKLSCFEGSSTPPRNGTIRSTTRGSARRAAQTQSSRQTTSIKSESNSQPNSSEDSLNPSAADSPSLVPKMVPASFDAGQWLFDTTATLPPICSWSRTTSSLSSDSSPDSPAMTAKAKSHLDLTDFGHVGQNAYAEPLTSFAIGRGCFEPSDASNIRSSARSIPSIDSFSLVSVPTLHSSLAIRASWSEPVVASTPTAAAASSSSDEVVVVERDDLSKQTWPTGLVTGAPQFASSLTLEEADNRSWTPERSSMPLASAAFNSTSSQRVNIFGGAFVL